MLTLTVLRHAKSSWDLTTLDDFDRPLSARGLKAAPLVARAIAERGPAIDFIFCSTAKRTLQTCDLAIAELGPSKPSVRTDDRLYHASPDLLMEVVHADAGTARHILLIGHNPGLEILALRLTRSGPPQAIAAMTQKFPTAAAAQLSFDIKTWAELQPGTGELIYFLTPRTLQ